MVILRQVENKILTTSIVTAGISNTKYGLLYNWYAATDPRGICSAGWQVMSITQWGILNTYLNAILYARAGSQLKETGIEFWESPNSLALNSVGFNGRGSGIRDGLLGTYINIQKTLHLIFLNEYNSTRSWMGFMSSNVEFFGNTDGRKTDGSSIRPFKITTSLTDGQVGEYIGNNGKKYPTICIAGIEILSCNLAETKFANGDWITGFDGGVYTPISNASWTAKTTGALCAYNND